ncbi:MAG: hypothetical protein ACRD4I_08805, partial [Candidatus Angelobacter sp.]
PVAAFPNLRALAWAGDELYTSVGYQLLRAKMNDNPITWQPVARYNPVWWRKLSACTPLSLRLFRDGFHALAILPSKHFVAAVPGAIISLNPGETEFRVTHHVTRGTRPLHIAATPDGQMYWGEYFDNPQRDEVHVYSSTDYGLTWDVIHTFPKGAIRHGHNIVYDPWEKCLWVLTGDNGAECRILKTNAAFTHVETLLSGNQQTRAVALVPSEEGIYFSSDTPFEQNYNYRLDRRGHLERLNDVNASSIYGCRVAKSMFFSTMVEPSRVNLSSEARLYGNLRGSGWVPLLGWQKDRWPMRWFQYGNIVLPDGHNTSSLLAITSVALQGGGLQTSIWKPRLP